MKKRDQSEPKEEKWLQKREKRVKKEKKEKKSFWENVKNEIREHRGVFVTYCLLWIVVVGVMVRAVMLGNYEHVFLCILTLVLFLLPTIVERTFQLKLPGVLEIIVYAFIFAAEILGEIGSFYQKIPFWDTMLHTVSGFLTAAVGFALVDVLNRSPKVKLQLSPIFLAFVAFCFTLTIGTLWEFFELSGDLILKKDMQKDTVVDFIYTVMLDDSNSNIVVRIEGIEDTILVLQDGSQVSLGVGGYLDVGLYDTMKDMFVNFIGALVFSTIGYFYVKSRGKGRIARQFIPVKQEASEANMNVIFIGMPTSGKSTVGVLVAKALGYGFIDADLVIQERKGKRLSEIISEVGPDAFNQIEEEINASIVADRSVIAPGGSVIYGPKAMEHYKSIGKVVYLRLSYEGVAARLKNARARGVSMKDGYTLKDLYEERAPLYERYADLTVDCDQKTLDEVVEETLHRLAEVTEE